MRSMSARNVVTTVRCSSVLWPISVLAQNSKGNINRKGDRIYHVPESHDYARAVIDERAGERMFCTEAEAQAAGWRAPM